MIVFLILVALIVMIMLNVPIAVALAICGVLGIISYEGTAALISIALDMFSGATNFSLIAIPMFVLAGAIMNAAGITRRLIEFVSALIGFVRGGLAMVNVGVSLFFAEISGSAVADVAAMGSVMIPEMKRRGYTSAFSAAVTSSSASLAIIIPPSIPMILYGVSSGASIEQLFLAGFVPGLIGAFGMMALCWWFARRYDLPREAAFDTGRLKKTFVAALPTFLLPIVILGGIFGGFFTATEAAGVAVIASIAIGLWYHETDFGELKRSMLDGAVQTAVVMLLVAASVLMGGFLTRAQIPQDLANGLIAFTDNRYAILAILNVFFLIIGFFLHSAAAIILVVPIVVPLIGAVGIDPVHFGLIVTLNLAIGQQTPPVASVLITACSIARANIWDVTKANLGFIGVLLFVLLLCTYVEPIPMFLVEWLYR